MPELKRPFKVKTGQLKTGWKGLKLMSVGLLPLPGMAKARIGPGRLRRGISEDTPGR
jgi:hypothetical protein